jgi:tetratricopeptide (TPR) repeat protein
MTLFMNQTIQIKFFKGIALAVLMFCCSVSLSLAQTPSVTASVNTNPTRMGSRIQISVTLMNCSSNSGQIPMKQIPGLTFLGGPATSHSTNWVNGKKTSKHVYTYSFSVATNKNISVPAIKLATSGGVLASKPFIIRVQAKGAKNTNNNSNNVLDQLSTVIKVSKNKVYIGEPVIIEYTIYNQYNGLEVREYNVPELKGFWQEDVKQEEQTWQTQIVNGKRYNTVTVKRIVAFPQQIGTFTVDGFDLKGYVRVNFFSGRNVEASSKPIVIEVMPLPDVKPAKFIGTFSNLSIESKVQIDTIKVNEAFNMTISYSGNGNMKLLRKPEIVWPTEFEVFDPEVKDRININKNGESGERVYKYVIIPRAPGDYKLPELKASYFDPRGKRYVSTSTAEENIVVVSADGDEMGGTTFGTKTDVAILNHDIRHINTQHSHWGSKHDGNNEKYLYLFLFLLGPFIAGASFLYRINHNNELRDPSGFKSKKAKKTLSKALIKCAEGVNKEEQFTKLGEALEVYLCAKFQLGRSSFSRTSAVETLHDLLGKEEASDWDKLLMTCEMARFAPGALPNVDTSISEAKKLADIGDERIKPNIIMSLIVLLIIGFTSATITASASINNETLDEKFKFANEAYIEGNYNEAALLYEEIAIQHQCFELEYNLGNVHYKLDDIGKALLHYERALLIKPLDADLRANLLLAELRAIDRIEELPGVGIDKLAAVIFAGNMYQIWLIISLITWTVAFVFIAIRLRWRNSLIAPYARGVATVSFILALIFISFLNATNKRISKSSCAIIMESRVEVRSMPGELGVSLFQLHEGTKACIQSTQDEWTEVLLENGNVGWLPTSAIEPI